MTAHPMPELQERLMSAGLGLTANDFYYYASDLYILDKPGVREWLNANYKFAGNVMPFIGAKETPWEGKRCLDVPFAGIGYR